MERSEKDMPQKISTSSEMAKAVQAARRRTLALVEDLNDDQLEAPLKPHLNPFLWELGHVAFFHEAFLLKELDGGDLLIPRGNELYNSFEVAHDDRWELGIPDRKGTLTYMAQVQSRVLERIEARDLTPQEQYLYRLVVQHEDMHGEAFTYMRQCIGLPAPQAVLEGRVNPRPDAGPCPGDVEIPAGTYLLGAKDDGRFAYDNEKWGHEVELREFAIARAPVTCAEFIAFLEDDGYTRRELWSLCGWNWRTREQIESPACWQLEDGRWFQANYDSARPVELTHPVTHISWFEVEAFCKWAGRRLPTEAEWELAASGEPGNRNAKRNRSWGAASADSERANLGAWCGGTVAVGDYAGGDSGFGCRQMIGNVWEWTCSEFYPFPGYILDHPYKEYSAPWFGDRKVLRGGSWATQPSLAYCTYRNFFPPNRRDIFAGFRTCAVQD